MHHRRRELAAISTLTSFKSITDADDGLGSIDVDIITDSLEVLGEVM